MNRNPPEFYSEGGNDDLVGAMSSVIFALQAFEAPLD